jgi:hypothetical protein
MILVFLAIFLIPGGQYAIGGEVPNAFYRSGFPESSGRYEPGVQGKSGIDFGHRSDYYGTPYDTLATFPFEQVPQCEIKRVTVNEEPVEYFTVFNNYIYSRFNKANGNDDLVIACMSGWDYDSRYTVTAYGVTPDGSQVELSITTASPKRDVEFRYPDSNFGSHYIVVELTEEELRGMTTQSVAVNGLPIREFKQASNKVMLIFPWTSPRLSPQGSRGIYDISLIGGNRIVMFKALASKSLMGFGYPSSNYPYYHLKYTFPKDEFGAFKVETVMVNGEEVRDFDMTDDGESRWDKKITGNSDLAMTVRCVWEKGESYNLTVKGIDEGGKTVVLQASGMAESGWGYWNKNWKYYATVVLEEEDGIKRVQEPVHIKMALYADRLTDPAREIRVAEFDPYMMNSTKGPHMEVPSQVYHIATWDDRSLIDEVETGESGERVIRYLPTTTLEVAFFADVERYSEKVYLVFYGNPNADAPVYEADLVVSGEEIGQSIENEMNIFDLDDNSGAFFTIFLKQGKDAVLEHKLETNGAIHWNPGAYSPPHAWVHASDWQNPHFEQVSGPVFHMTKRWAPLPHMDNVHVMITYVFYAGKPYVITTSYTELEEEIFVKTIRNGEIVFNHVELNEFVYLTPRGNIDGFMIEGSRPHPAHAIHIPYDTPWQAFINREKGIGFAGITLELANTNKYGGLSDAEYPYFYVANGPWIYWSRALNYSFGSNNTSRMIRAKKGSIYYEKTAYMPFVLGEKSPDEFRMVEEADAMLRNPLHVSYHLDTDNRNNKGWVVPILVEPFDEGVEGAVGAQED